MKLFNSPRQESRTIPFTIKLSKKENEFLERQARINGKSKTQLIREGYIQKRKEMDLRFQRSLL